MENTLISLAHGFAIAFEPGNLWYAFIGCLVGTLVGVLPGIGPLSGISILLPVTFGLNATEAVIMLAGIYYGSQYGGSTTSILMRIPGEASSVMTCIDGNAMAKNKFLGDAHPTVGARAIFDGETQGFSFGANLAGVYRKSVKIGGTDLGTEFRYAFGAGYRVSPVFRVLAEGFGLPPTQPDQAPERYAKWLEEFRDPPTLRPYATFDEVADRLKRNNPRISDARAQFLAPHWAEQRADGGIHLRADPLHKMVNPVLYRTEEAMACWRRIVAPVLWLWGDESLRSQGGNNNAWCHDGPAWWLDWDAAARTPACRLCVADSARDEGHAGLASTGEGRAGTSLHGSRAGQARSRGVRGARRSRAPLTPTRWWRAASTRCRRPHG